MKIQEINKLAINDLFRLIQESTEEGYRHINRLVEEYENGINTFSLEGEALFVALYNDEIIGICGLNQDPYINDTSTGRVRRMYVLKDYRRYGIGSMLMKAVIDKANIHFKRLVLHTDCPAASRFYLRLGFSETKTLSNASHCLEHRNHTEKV